MYVPLKSKRHPVRVIFVVTRLPARRSRLVMTTHWIERPRTICAENSSLPFSERLPDRSTIQPRLFAVQKHAKLELIP
jgi:hypothetical protein